MTFDCKRFILSRGWSWGNCWEESGIKSFVPKLSTNVGLWVVLQWRELRVVTWSLFGAKGSLEWTCRQRIVKLFLRGDECSALNQETGSDYRLILWYLFLLFSYLLPFLVNFGLLTRGQSSENKTTASFELTRADLLSVRLDYASLVFSPIFDWFLPILAVFDH